MRGQQVLGLGFGRGRPFRTPWRHQRLRSIAFVLISSLASAGVAGTTHWAFAPLKEPPLPAVNDRAWCRNPIDRFIFARLEQLKLSPSLPAGKRTLLRRVYFDLIGLPPTPQEMRTFLDDPDPRAYERIVDRLLASPRYGERWARHWMDVIHYAETHGNDQDRERPNAWPYRDYLIHSFNDDKPYGRFVREQVAGDVMYPDDPQGIVATGFIVAGPWDESSQVSIQNTVDKRIAQNLDRDDMTTVTINTFVSMTVQCARCHNHKFDPISQKEYYGLQAVFAGVDRADRPYDPDPKIWAERKTLLREKETFGRDYIRQMLYALAFRQTSTRQVASDARWMRDEIDRKLAALPPRQWVYAPARDFKPNGNFTPAASPRPVFVLKRGDVTQPGDPAEPGALSCVSELDPRFHLADPQDEGSRRAALAGWLSDSRNVLTWRSIANRVWQYHFGQGIAATPSDFGEMGTPPTHPELLDYLACYLLEHGQSLKSLHRLIVTSATYRQSSRPNATYAKVDGSNQYLWRMNASRLDAESIRDAILQISGTLDLSMGGPSVKQFAERPGIHVTPLVEYDKFDVDSPASRRRSVYRFIFRTIPDPFMEAMDCPDASQLTPVRTTSVSALQALAMWNDKFLLRYSQHLAERIQGERSDLRAQVARLYELSLNRDPAPDELKAVMDYAKTNGLANACRVLLNSNEFVFVE